MHSRLVLTIALVLLAVVAAAAILFLFRAQPQPAPAAPTLTITGETIIDERTGEPVPADVYVNSALYRRQVTSFTLTVPLTAATEVTVTAAGYRPWSLTFRAGGSESKTVSGPIRLQPIE